MVPIPENEPLTKAAADRITSFPRLVKPRSCAGSRGVAKIDSRADLDAVPKDGTSMLQEFLPRITRSMSTSRATAASSAQYRASA